MAALSAEVKAFVVQALACFDTPSKVVESVQAEFGVKVSRQQVEGYDPTKVTGKSLSKKWVDVFHAARERFQSEIADIPIANKAYRLRVLDRMATKTENMKNFALTAQLIEQASKESGDAHRLQQMDIERRQLEIEKLRRELADDDEENEPVPVAINLSTVDARVRDDSADA
ncbi:DUF2280 domain-containing protein [Pectobacterium odoriferum]|uniref:DUF2280 domain-containing protein n=1 Tax=Pectobacterium odoriferum TaxID=78398 RepID=UPI0009B8A97C|nr:DUF2280 domain-containing protein [Pectobacterium odoriferum]